MSSEFYEGKEILITGGTGFLGNKLTEMLVENYNPKGLRIYARNEENHRKMKLKFKKHKNIEFCVGDIRDYQRLCRACEGVDIIIHACAMKQLPIAETNIMEAKKTNIDGTENVINAAIEKKVDTVIYTNSDKSVYGINFYGITKAAGEKMMMYASNYSGFRTKLITVRYPNIYGSTGSILPMFKEMYSKNKTIGLTSPEMTRFFVDANTICDFILTKAVHGKSGTILIPKVKSMNIKDLIDILYPDAIIKDIGLRRGEKLAECLIGYEESHHCVEHDNYYVIDESTWNETRFMLDSDNVRRLTKKDIDGFRI